MTRPLGIGLVGAGRFGEFCVAAFADLPGVRIVAVTDAARDRAETVAALADGQATVHEDLEGLLDDPAVDIVHVGTPPYLHGPVARRAAERGKHVFVEKPLATSLAEGVGAVAAARLAGVQLSIDYVLRHHPLHRLAIALSRSGALGRLQLFALENFASCEALPPDHWFWDRARSGGIHVEHGVHFFDLCVALAGRLPDVVCGSTQRRPDGAADRMSALLGFGDELVASFHHAFNRAAATERTTIRLAFERGHATIEGWIPTRLAVEGEVSASEVTQLRKLFGAELVTIETRRGTVAVSGTAEAPDRQGEYRDAIRAGMSDLVAAIRGERPLAVTAEDGIRSLEIALRATGA